MTVIVYYPTSEKGKHELEKRVAGVHADVVMQHINSLTCSTEQKIALVNDLISENKSNSDGE